MAVMTVAEYKQLPRAQQRAFWATASKEAVAGAEWRAVKGVATKQGWRAADTTPGLRLRRREVSDAVVAKLYLTTVATDERSDELCLLLASLSDEALRLIKAALPKVQAIRKVQAQKRKQIDELRQQLAALEQQQELFIS